ncbi:heterokaryon incompatibility protein-domain-containing protein [Nemania sp. NC0429]|nr:heterokaryon incompatibility protein-domain-containing protein [Nemania sp. NC0429]
MTERSREQARASINTRGPSPPGLTRVRSTGRDNRLPRWDGEQHAPRTSRREKIKDSLYLDLDVDAKPQRNEPKRSDTSFRTSSRPPTPIIVVRQAPISLRGQSRHADHSHARVEPVRDYLRPPTLLSASSSGALGPKIFYYEKLRPLEFRLVRVLAKMMSAVRCEIIHYSLTDPPPYIAISYAWGDPDDKRDVQVGSVKIPVAVSLFGALDAVRKRGEDVLVWVDALCIDQQNRDERSSQVQQMAEIYAKAREVAIWLGPSENDSELAIELLQDIAIARDDFREIADLLFSPSQLRAVGAVVSLFQRDYWKRLWVVQEVYNAKTIKVYCGNSPCIPWVIYKKAAHVFKQHKRDLDLHFSANSLPQNRRLSGLQSSLSHSQALVYEGPSSLYDYGSLDGLGEEALLNVVRACRRKLASEPRDKIFGILGILPDAIQKLFTVDYNLSVKVIYTNVVDFLLNSTERLDVICESIHFPKQTSITQLPSWVPDWSQIPDVTALGYLYDYAAAGDTLAGYRLLGERRNELEVSAILVDTVRTHGIAVGTRCTLADYLMAFLHWHAILMENISSGSFSFRESMEDAFCRTLCLGQVPPKTKNGSRPYSPSEWRRICYHTFAAQLQSRLPWIILDKQLQQYVNMGEEYVSDMREFLQSNFGARMMGRCLILTERDHIGMGSGFVLPDDLIIIPLGCRTPIIIRNEGNKSERYRFVGDLYLDGYMDGEVIAQLEARERKLEKFVLI